MRVLAVALVLVSAACASGDGLTVAGESEEQALRLDPGDAMVWDVRATLDFGGAGAGEVSIEVEAGDGSAGSFTMTFLSTTSGEQNEAEVLDTEAQPKTTLAVAAFDGCGSDKCAEETQFALERTAEEAGSLDLTWIARGTFTFDSGGNKEAGIFFNIHARTE